MTGLELDIEAGIGNSLYEIERPGPAGSNHSHKLRIMSIPYSEREEIYIELSEPGGCGCYRRLTLAQLAHVLVNTSYDGLLAIEAKEICPMGHEHFSKNFR